MQVEVEEILMMHLVADLRGHAEAMRRKIPFYRTACGGTAKMSMLTSDPSGVGCAACRQAYERWAEQQRQKSSPPTTSAESSDFNDMDFDDLDDGFDAVAPVVTPPAAVAPAVPAPVAPAPVAPAVLAPVAPVPVTPAPDELVVENPLDTIMAAFAVLDPIEAASRLVVEVDEDPLGSEGFTIGPMDFRCFISPDELDFLRKLVVLSDQLGLGDLSSRVLTVLYQVIVRMSMSIANEHGDEDDDDGDSDEFGGYNEDEDEEDNEDEDNDRGSNVEEDGDDDNDEGGNSEEKASCDEQPTQALDVVDSDSCAQSSGNEEGSSKKKRTTATPPKKRGRAKKTVDKGDSTIGEDD